MKKITRSQWLRDVARSLEHRRQIGSRQRQGQGQGSRVISAWRTLNGWLDAHKRKGLQLENYNGVGRRSAKNAVILYLPEKMDFGENRKETVLHLKAIRKFSEIYYKYKDRKIPSKCYKLKTVNFSRLKDISAPAALVLTAEIAKWDTTIRKQLSPMVDDWNEIIYSIFYDLGFFDLFSKMPDRQPLYCLDKEVARFVKYRRGKCNDYQAKIDSKKWLKESLQDLVGEKIPKWTFLSSALSEAITNVSHHAYPEGFYCSDESWYLTGSYNKKNKELMIAFYDQGVGIPNSLEESEIWEKILAYFSKAKIFSPAEKKLHSVLLKAAVSIDRTSTKESDRGKGLQDFLDFIRQRGQGSLTIISYFGQYYFKCENGIERTSTDNLKQALPGTLITWCATLDS